MGAKQRSCAALGVTLALGLPAAANATTASQSFSTTGEHAFQIPSGVTSLQVLLVGGNGGPGPISARAAESARRLARRSP
jgi:hypothetical protein